MPTLCEPLESRMLLSVSTATVQADSVAIKKDLGVVHADIGKCNATANHDAASLSAALGKSKTAADRSLLSTLHQDLATCFALIKTHFAVVQHSGSRDVGKVLADDKILARRPGDTATLARRATDLAALFADSVAITLAADAGACRTAENTDLNAIGAAHTSDSEVQAAIANAKTNANNCVSTLSADQRKVRADIATFESDAAPL